MSRDCRVLLCILVTGVLSNLSFAVVPDRIPGALAGGPKVAIRGNVHGHVRPENDLGRADGSRLMQGITLAFHPSEAQQKDLDRFLAELGDRKSPNYHKYLTPKQFGQRFGMSSNDLNKVTEWLKSEGFTNIKVANGRNEVSFDGTVAQIESAFNVEMHHYLVDSVVHLANAGNASVPAALASSVLNVGGLNTFAPKPRAKVKQHLTSYISGSHFLTPGDFAKIYDLSSIGDGTGQTIAVIGQSAINTSDLDNFRSAAGLPASTVTITPVPANSTPTRCGGDEGESDLDLEWSGGIAPKANIVFVVASLGSGDTCSGSRTNSVWDALKYALQNNVAPFVSTSYGFCESGLGASFAKQVQGWVRQGQTQGQTVVSATGDAGAADCDTGSSATQGLAVDVPGSIPEVTAAGGTEFVGDGAGTVSGSSAAATQYWAASGNGSDGLTTALGYIPEQGWNDTSTSITNGGGLSATGGGASDVAGGFFAKPSWQTGSGVPSDGARDVPDISLSASPDHDGYLFCSEDDGSGGTVSTCTAGFRTGAGGSFTVVGGTSVAAPTFSAILALINQYVGEGGITPVNPTLYQLAASNPAAFNDVKTGDNMVPCTTGTPNCPSGTTQIGFSAGPGYDLVTGLGSVNALTLAQAWTGIPAFSLKAQPAYQVTQGSSIAVDVTVTQLNGFNGAITYTCLDSAPESTCSVPSGSGSTFNITTTSATAKLGHPSEHGSKLYYALLLPGVFGSLLLTYSVKRSSRRMKLVGLTLCLAFSMALLPSCGGSSSKSNKGSGTPVGSYTITVTGTATVNGNPMVREASFQLIVQ